MADIIPHPLLFTTVGFLFSRIPNSVCKVSLRLQFLDNVVPHSFWRLLLVFASDLHRAYCPTSRPSVVRRTGLLTTFLGCLHGGTRRVPLNEVSIVASMLCDSDSPLGLSFALAKSSAPSTPRHRARALSRLGRVFRRHRACLPARRHGESPRPHSCSSRPDLRFQSVSRPRDGASTRTHAG